MKTEPEVKLHLMNTFLWAQSWEETGWEKWEDR